MTTLREAMNLSASPQTKRGSEKSMTHRSERSTGERSSTRHGGDRDSRRAGGSRSGSPNMMRDASGSDDNGGRDRGSVRGDRGSTRGDRGSTRGDRGSTRGDRESGREARDKDRQNRSDRANRTKQRRTRRTTSSPHDSGHEMGWSRPSRSPKPAMNRASSRDGIGTRQLIAASNAGPPPLATKETDSIDELVAQHQQVDFANFGSGGSVADASSGSKNKKSSSKSKRSSTKAAIASSNDIDAVIAQFRDHCDMHMATLLELKNNITTTEKEVVVSTEKDKEFEQVRKWYSALAEKHNKLQKEHQALQEEHVKLQEKYMNLKREKDFQQSFVDAGIDQDRKKDKKDKKDKTIGDIVWSRAGKM